MSKDIFSVDDRFKKFLSDFTNEGGERKYEQRLYALGYGNPEPLVVDFFDLYAFDEELAMNLIENPVYCLRIFEEVSHRNRVRVKHLPVSTPIRDVDTEKLERFMMVGGIVVKSSQEYSKIKEAAFECTACGEEFMAVQRFQFLERPQKRCKCKNRSKAWRLRLDHSKFADSQTIYLQEPPDQLPPGEIPRSLEVSLENDLVGSTKPGDRVKVTGVIGVKMSSPNSSNLELVRYIYANHVEVVNREMDVMDISKEDEDTINELKEDPWIDIRLINSMAPNIYGHYSIKKALMLQQFGSDPIDKGDVRIRGDINVLLCGDPGTSKALSIETQVPTPKGWEKIKNIKEGDRVFDEKGNICKVIASTPIMYNHKTYEVVLNDGASIIADEGHLWLTSTRSSRVSKQRRSNLEERGYINSSYDQSYKRTRDSVKTTKQIKNTLKWKQDGRNNHAIIVADYLKTRKKQLLIPPYTLGAWLGDGTSIDGSITCSEDEIIKRIKEDGFIVRSQNKEIGYGILGLKTKLGKLNLLNNKHIPKKYFRASVEQRLNLLRGLMDTDGCCSKNHGCSFSNTNKSLIDGMSELLHSLGIKHTMKQYTAKIYNKNCGIYYQINFTTDKKVFLLSRKLNRLPKKIRSTQNKRYIISINEVKSVPVKCIQVNSKNGLFLVGRNMIPTHNSQLLQYATSLSQRGIYTTGRGSTGAGLTAAAIKDKSGQFVLEAGALVIADKGLCAIDELEKMSEVDRAAIHPALEQQIVAISKGGINATLNARTSVLAAANPKMGRYDPYQSVAENIGNLPVTLLSRFDLIFVIRDLPEEQRDRDMGQVILDMAGEAVSPIPQEMLKKYIAYSKNLNPIMTKEAKEKLIEFYVEARQSSAKNDAQGGKAIAITPRQLESLLRLTRAHARALLRETVLPEDADHAIELFKVSMEQVGIDPATGKMDIDLIELGRPRSLQDKMFTVLKAIDAISKEEGAASLEKISEAMIEGQGFSEQELNKIISTLMREGTIFSPRPNYYRKT